MALGPSCTSHPSFCPCSGLVPHVLGDVIFLWCCNLLAHFINTYAVDDNVSGSARGRAWGLEQAPAVGRGSWGAGADLIQTPGFGDVPVRVLGALCLLRAVLHLWVITVCTLGDHSSPNAFPDSQLECSCSLLLSASSPAPRLGVRECHTVTVPAWCHPPAPQRLWFLSAVQPGLGDPELHQVRDGGM